eukprot:3775002-Pyramimonas_sp.AAC.1
MARSLGRGEQIAHFFQKLDREIVRDARGKAQTAIGRAGKAAGKGPAQPAQAKGSSGKGSNGKCAGGPKGARPAPVSPVLRRRSRSRPQADRNKKESQWSKGQSWQHGKSWSSR